MWLRTVNGIRFFKVEYTEQGLPIPVEDIKLKHYKINDNNIINSVFLH